MLESTVKRLENLSMERTGYITTEELLQSKITNRQIGVFVDMGMLEKISHGHYWIVKADCGKPEDYKALEVCITNPGAVICADSACFYLGLISVEPESISVATKRSDRSKMKVTFPVHRHYFGDALFGEDTKKVTSSFGTYTLYDVERSVVDCIRFKDDIDSRIFEMVIENYRKRGEKKRNRLLEYARKVRILKRVEAYRL